MDLAQNLTPLKSLVGTWAGNGQGEYPTIEPFSYTEELTFTNIGKPFLVYVQKTWSPKGDAMHTETGYLRMPAPGIVELVLAQPTGQSELLEGTFEADGDGFRIKLEGKIMNTSTAKTVDATERTYIYAPGSLTTRFGMAAVGVPMSHHLSSSLSPVQP